MTEKYSNQIIQCLVQGLLMGWLINCAWCNEKQSENLSAVIRYGGAIQDQPLHFNYTMVESKAKSRYKYIMQAMLWLSSPQLIDQTESALNERCAVADVEEEMCVV